MVAFIIRRNTKKHFWQTIASNSGYSIALKSDGTVVGTGLDNKFNVSTWKGIVGIATLKSGPYGLKSDGTVVFNNWCGDTRTIQLKGMPLKDIVEICDWDGGDLVLMSDGRISTVEDLEEEDIKEKKREDFKKLLSWSNIVAIKSGIHTVGLRSDGTVAAFGDNMCGQCDVSDWRDIVAIAIGSYHTVGLRADGTVVAVGKNISGQCNVSDWRDIIAIAAGDNYTIGLKTDGTVVHTDSDTYLQEDISEWKGIHAITADKECAVGLKADGTVVTTDYYSQEIISDWNGIVAIAAAEGNIVGLRSDGTAVAVGTNTFGECNVSGWRDLMLPKR